MTTTPVFTRRRRAAAETHPVELRFVDMLLIVIATLMFVAIVLSVVSAFSGHGNAVEPPRVTTRSAPEAIVGQPYQLTIAVEGGDGDYVWEAAGGRLPAGLTLSPDGIIEGTPVEVQTTRFSVRVTDGSRRASEPRTLRLGVRLAGTGDTEPVPPRLVSRTVLLEGAVAGQDYRHEFAADAGQPPYRWRGSELPEGLRLTEDGTLAGRPEAGTKEFAVTIRDATGATTRQEVTLVVADAPETTFQRILRWLTTIATYYGYFCMVVSVILLLTGYRTVLMKKEGRS